MTVTLIKQGKDHNQAIAYLDDGTMIVIDSARKEGDKTVIANTSTSTDDDGKETTTTQGYYAVFFTGSNNNTFPALRLANW